MSEIGDRVNRGSIFIKLDLKDKYHLICVIVGVKWKTALRICLGFNEYTVMPFGFVKASSTFQEMMKKVLGGFLEQGVVVYVDYIFIYFCPKQKHQILVSNNLQRSQDESTCVVR